MKRSLNYRPQLNILEDRVTPVQQSKTWASLIPHADVKIVAGSGHLLLDESAEGPRAVLDFLS